MSCTFKMNKKKSYKIEEHSCKTCRYMLCKKNKSTRNYYYCKFDECVITDSVFQINECLFFSPK